MPSPLTTTSLLSASGSVLDVSHKWDHTPCDLWHLCLSHAEPVLKAHPHCGTCRVPFCAWVTVHGVERPRRWTCGLFPPFGCRSLTLETSVPELCEAPQGPSKGFGLEGAGPRGPKLNCNPCFAFSIQRRSPLGHGDRRAPGGARGPRPWGGTPVGSRSPLSGEAARLLDARARPHCVHPLRPPGLQCPLTLTGCRTVSHFHSPSLSSLICKMGQHPRFRGAALGMRPLLSHRAARGDGCAPGLRCPVQLPLTPRGY